MTVVASMFDELNEFRRDLWGGASHIQRTIQVTLHGKISTHDCFDLSKYERFLRYLWADLVPSIHIRREYVQVYEISLATSARELDMSGWAVTSQLGIGLLIACCIKVLVTHGALQGRHYSSFMFSSCV